MGLLISLIYKHLFEIKTHNYPNTISSSVEDIVRLYGFGVLFGSLIYITDTNNFLSDVINYFLHLRFTIDT